MMYDCQGYASFASCSLSCCTTAKAKFLGLCSSFYHPFYLKFTSGRFCFLRVQGPLELELQMVGCGPPAMVLAVELSLLKSSPFSQPLSRCFSPGWIFPHDFTEPGWHESQQRFVCLRLPSVGLKGALHTTQALCSGRQTSYQPEKTLYSEIPV